MKKLLRNTLLILTLLTSTEVVSIDTKEEYAGGQYERQIKPYLQKDYFDKDFTHEELIEVDKEAWEYVWAKKKTLLQYCEDEDINARKRMLILCTGGVRGFGKRVATEEEKRRIFIAYTKISFLDTMTTIMREISNHLISIENPWPMLSCAVFSAPSFFSLKKLSISVNENKQADSFFDTISSLSSCVSFDLKDKRLKLEKNTDLVNAEDLEADLFTMSVDLHELMFFDRYIDVVAAKIAGTEKEWIRAITYCLRHERKNLSSFIHYARSCIKAYSIGTSFIYDLKNKNSVYRDIIEKEAIAQIAIGVKKFPQSINEYNKSFLNASQYLRNFEDYLLLCKH